MKFTTPIAGLLALGAATSASPLPSQLSFNSAQYTDAPLSLFSSIYEASRDILTPRLVQTAPDAEPFWALPQYLRWRGVRFMDVTDHLELGTTYTLAHFTAAAQQGHDAGLFPKKMSYQSKVRSVHELLTEDGPRSNIAKFSSFYTRYYKSDTGKQSQQWLLGKVREITSVDDSITVDEFKHPWGQNSIIAHIPATNQSAAEQNGMLIVGAHQDSVNLIWPYFRAPGADDDGSGTVTQLEALRALLEAGWRPETSDVEFHWYSAEEGGLLGSQAVAEDYAKRGVNVKAMNQVDMSAFVKKDVKPAIGIVTDKGRVETGLTEFNRKLVTEYLDIPYVDTAIGAAGSDHESWTKVGIPAAFCIGELRRAPAVLAMSIH